MSTNRKELLFSMVLVFMFITFAVTPLIASESTIIQKEIEEMLVCQDDCGMLVSACDNATASYMREIITEQVAQGKSKEEVLQYFVNIYGEKVLAAPRPRGFNSTAYIIPFLAVFLGGLIIYFALEKWVFHNRFAQLPTKWEEEKLSEVVNMEYEKQLEDELKNYW